MKVKIFACGNITRYAPRIPEIAPDAPTDGIGLEGSPGM